MKLEQNDPVMEQAWGIIKHLSADEQERVEAEAVAVEKSRRDLVARLGLAELLGHTTGPGLWNVKYIIFYRSSI